MEKHTKKNKKSNQLLSPTGTHNPTSELENVIQYKPILYDGSASELISELLGISGVSVSGNESQKTTPTPKTHSAIPLEKDKDILEGHCDEEIVDIEELLSLEMNEEVKGKRKVKSTEKYNDFTNYVNEVQNYNLLKGKGDEAVTALTLEQFLSRKDIDYRWIMEHFVMKEEKDFYRKNVESLIKYFRSVYYESDVALLNDFMEDEPSFGSNLFIAREAYKIFKAIFACKNMERIEIDEHGRVVSDERLKHTNRTIHHRFHRLVSFLESKTEDPTISCIAFQQTCDHLILQLQKELDSQMYRRKTAMEVEMLNIIKYVDSLSLPRNSLEYHCIYLVYMLLADLIEEINSFQNLMDEWIDTLYECEESSEELNSDEADSDWDGSKDNDDDDDDDDEEEEFMIHEKVGKEVVVEEISSALKRPSLLRFPKPELENTTKNTKKTSPTPKQQPKKTTTTTTSPASRAKKVQEPKQEPKKVTKAAVEPKETKPKTRNKKTPVVNIPLQFTPIMADIDGDTSVDGDDFVDPPSKTTNSVMFGEDRNELQFYTLLKFSKELQRAYLIPPKSLIPSMKSGNINVVATLDTNNESINDTLNADNINSIRITTKNSLPSSYTKKTVEGSKDENNQKDDDNNNNNNKWLILLSQNANNLPLSFFVEFTKSHDSILKMMQSKTPLNPDNVREFFHYYGYMFNGWRSVLYTFLFAYLPSQLNLDYSRESFDIIVNDFTYNNDGLILLKPVKEQVKGKEIISYIEQFYSFIYTGHPRGNEWQKDKGRKHALVVAVTQTEMKKFRSVYSKIQELSNVQKEVESIVLFPHLLHNTKN
eukprot:TRINITY_DN720_c5_g1_i1.p1 TRINITY_DN720_c5_g1~~TRINITY_DN720_c5_g1_i1.p1  ORF type:complete len:821 (+),score=189.66 TRINITY_DN720_c5_g1_i1:1079-3541(+)